MTKVQAWVNAFRLRTLPLALSSIIMGSGVAAYHGTFNWNILALAALTTLFLQVLSNLANDYGDTINGADHEERQGPERMVQSGLISKQSMLRGIFVMGTLALISGLGLITIAFQDISITSLIFFILGIAAIGAAVKYTMGSNPYGYRGLGDVYVLLFFGLIGVGGTYYLHAQKIDFSAILPALSVGFLSAGVLNLNNMRDVESDTSANKNTLVVKFGLQWARKYQYTMVLGAIICSVLFLVLNHASLLAYLFLISLPLFIRHLLVVKRARGSKDFDPELKKLALSTFLFVLLFTLGLVIS
ncbi:MAG: 1,4-dihydroxy-2-naphthoate polyprenyltransferase [Carboxylicivirga sp.]|jgi:1,4-dihydroxy-2-naphthoate octaprenyltransferase|nr:1,4-dihydroxy-2-naphthoate polyprenyltransferase [Carboxylicivirga sp.]